MVRSNSAPKDYIKVYVINPKEFQNGESSSLLASLKQEYDGSAPRNPHSESDSLENQVSNEEDDERTLVTLLSKQCKTRSGRVTKPRVYPDTIENDSLQPAKVRQKGRDPPEFFRCQTCRKFYVGNTKLKAHLQKFPTHEGSLEYQKSISPKRKVVHVSVSVQSYTSIPLVSEPVCAATTSDEGQESKFLVPEHLPSTIEAGIFAPVTSVDNTTRSQDLEQIQSFKEFNSNRATAVSPPTTLPFWNSFSRFNNAGREESSSSISYTTHEVVPSTSASVQLTASSVRKEEQLDPITSNKSIWDIVEKKISQNGINHILAELSDVAEKLGKIARDKIIPIREDEEERLPNSTPIVRVENPFMSHLLDLPFGTYVFREDGGIRRPPMPPPSTDLSLTAGEVDIDKFLACNMEMDLSLPHLTSLDIAAVCNN